VAVGVDVAEASGVFVGVLVGDVETVPPPKSSRRASAASANHNPIYPPLAYNAHPVILRVASNAPFL
jgi:hypothetical protein